MNRPLSETYDSVATGTGGRFTVQLRHGLNSVLAKFRDNIAESGRHPRNTAIGFAVAWGLFFLIGFGLPTPKGLSSAGMACLAVVIWACVIWVSEAIPVGITGILIPMLLVMSGATKTFGQAVGGYISEAAFVCLIAFLIAAIVQAAGLDRRLALTLLHKAKVKTVNGVIWVLFGVNFLLSFVIPGSNPRGALMLPVMKGITDLLGDTPAEQAAKK